MPGGVPGLMNGGASLVLAAIRAHRIRVATIMAAIEVGSKLIAHPGGGEELDRQSTNQMPTVTAVSDGRNIMDAKFTHTSSCVRGYIGIPSQLSAANACNERFRQY